MRGFQSTPGDSRSMLLRAAGIAWLTLISAATIVNHASLSSLATQASANVQASQVVALEAGLTELNQSLDTLQKRPVALTQARYETDSKTLEQRMTAIEIGLKQRLTAASLSSLETRIDQLTTRLDKPNQTTPVPVRTRVTHPTKPTQAAGLPFTVMGIELRGGERFLSILPTGNAAFSEMRVLRPGETDSGWRLQAIDGQTAVFQRENDGQTHRLTLP
ncbi:hypothetical protein WG29040_01945 [Pseudomonas sp. PAMC 29040]|uniref:hypothetical protein n=1 Tax=Pseudomonas sp. PAMC 29040 TaxID=2498450 RepID=UPI000FADD400|nr:hypothetical protein [Pseudomonas sp. PAMC 29040]RUT42369.1 hypothetical protein WG29040_01945 [Pseudomonas sp. PAMC 29040]